MRNHFSVRFLAFLALALLIGPRLACAEDVIIHGIVRTTTSQPIFMIKVSVYQDTRLLNKVYTDDEGRYEVAVPSGQMLAILFDTHPTLNNARMWHPSVILNLAASGPMALDRTLVQVGQTGGYTADIDAFMAYQFGTFILEKGGPGAMDETYAEVAVERLNELKLTSTYLNEAERDLVAYLSAKH
jgi:hypothetical protein